MLAMLRKDWYVMGKFTAVYILAWMVIVGAIAWIPGAQRHVIVHTMPVIGITGALNAVSSDHECHWDRFAAMSPLRPWELVVEKYLFAYGMLALMAGLGALVSWAGNPGGAGREMWTTVVLVSLHIAVALPLVYRFGRQKGVAGLFTLWGLILAAVLGMAHWNYTLLAAVFDWLAAVPAAGAAGGLLAANAVSVPLSIHIYTRRQRGWYA